MTTIDAKLSDLATLYRNSTAGTWLRGQTSHHTVTETGYKIGEFHHACDAAFCDAAHDLVPTLLAEFAALRAALTEAQTVPKPFLYERDSALCEANCDAESDAFFAARPTQDSAGNRRIFYAGHRKAWINYPIVVPNTAQPVPTAAAVGAVKLTETQINQGLMALLQCSDSDLESYSTSQLERYTDDVRRVVIAAIASKGAL